MTVTFRIPFERIALKDGADPHVQESYEYVTDWYTIRVTDKTEPRDSWKRPEAIRRACARFEEDRGWEAGQGIRHIRRDKIEVVKK